MRSVRACLTAGLACIAPNTVIDAIVSRASSGVMSSAMVTNPSTLSSRRSPAARASSSTLREPEIKAPPRHRLADHVRVPIELVSDGRSDAVRTVRIMPFGYEQIDMA